jgi:type IV secretion system protein VirB4
MTKVTRKQNTMLMANDKAASQIEELSHAADDLLGRKYVLGNHSLVLIAFADNAKAMNEVGNAAWRDLAACGLVATRMTKALQAAYLSMLPGAESWRPRPGFVKSRNLCAFFPFYNWPTGRARAHWPGPPIACFRTMAGTLFRFHWHVEDLGNTLVTGLPGGGKTLATGFLLANTAGRARIVALDHKRGWQFLIERLGGSYAVLGAGRPSLAPLKALDAEPHNIDFLTTLIRGCIGGQMTEEEGRRLSVALHTVMRLPPSLRNMGEIRAFFDGNPEGAGARLEKWVWGNELGWVVDAPVNTVHMTGLMGLDTTQLLKNPRARGPAMSVLFHYIDLMLDGSPILIPIDEGWRALEDEVFRPAIAEKIRTIRSKGGAIVFITQSPGDIVKAGIADVLIDMCPTQMHFANPRASKADFVEGLKMSEGQWEAFRPIQPGEGMFLLVQGNQGVVLQLPLQHDMDDYIGVLSAREADLQRADRIEAVSHQELEAA